MVELKAATISVSSQWLKDLLLGVKTPYTSNIPKDIQIFNVEYDSKRHIYNFIAISDEFDVVPEGFLIPHFDAIITELEVDESNR